MKPIKIRIKSLKLINHLIYLDIPEHTDPPIPGILTPRKTKFSRYVLTDIPAVIDPSKRKQYKICERRHPYSGAC